MEDSPKKLKKLAEDQKSSPEKIKHMAEGTLPDAMSSSRKMLTALIITIVVAVIAAVAYSKIHPQDECDLYPDLKCGKYADDNNGGDSNVVGYRTCILNLVGGGLPECSDGTHGGDGLPKQTRVNGRLYDMCRYVSASGECQK